MRFDHVPRASEIKIKVGNVWNDCSSVHHSDSHPIGIQALPSGSSAAGCSPITRPHIPCILYIYICHHARDNQIPSPTGECIGAAAAGDTMTRSDCSQLQSAQPKNLYLRGCSYCSTAGKASQPARTIIIQDHSRAAWLLLSEAASESAALLDSHTSSDQL